MFAPCVIVLSEYILRKNTNMYICGISKKDFSRYDVIFEFQARICFQDEATVFVSYFY